MALANRLAPHVARRTTHVDIAVAGVEALPRFRSAGQRRARRLVQPRPAPGWPGPRQ